MNSLISSLGIDESSTKVMKKEKYYTSVKDSIPEEANYNMMCDLLMLPMTPQKYRYLLVVVDLYTDKFDMEPLKSKEPSEVLSAFKKMFKRGYIKKPYASMQTDGGSEFKGVFSKYLYDNSILHKEAKKGRHSQMANVERLNRTLGRLLNGLMNKKERETDKVFTKWTDFLGDIRTKLNAYRTTRRNDNIEKEPTVRRVAKEFNQQIKQPKFKVGDMVKYKLDVPENSLGKELDGKFREGDSRISKTARKILTVTATTGMIPYRYILEGMPHVSYTESQLTKTNETASTYKVKKIIGERTRNKAKEYLVWWENFKKSEASWEPKSQLEQDMGVNHVANLVKQFKDSKKK
jgi:hypothetical protein